LAGFFINLLMIIALLGDARAAGVEARCAKCPQERLLLSLQDFNRAESREKCFNFSKILLNVAATKQGVPVAIQVLFLSA
jgi:hypothetical protein